MAVQGPVDNRYKPFLNAHDITVVCVTDLDQAPGMFFLLLLCELTCPLFSPRALSSGCAMPRVFTLSFFVFYVSIFLPFVSDYTLPCDGLVCYSHQTQASHCGNYLFPFLAIST